MRSIGTPGNSIAIWCASMFCTARYQRCGISSSPDNCPTSITCREYHRVICTKSSDGTGHRYNSAWGTVRFTQNWNGWFAVKFLLGRFV